MSCVSAPSIAVVEDQQRDKQQMVLAAVMDMQDLVALGRQQVPGRIPCCLEHVLQTVLWRDPRVPECIYCVPAEG